MKRKGTIKLISFAAATLIVLSTAISMVSAGDMPGADASALWQYITKTDPYTKWEFWPGKEGMYKGTFPHGAHLKLYANKIALDAAKAGKEMPSGAIVVKENYGKDATTLMAVTPMYKIEGFNPEAGDWFWAKHKADSSIEKSGKVEGCIKCHAKVKNQNWIFNTVK